MKLKVVSLINKIDKLLAKLTPPKKEGEVPHQQN
jgi:hypothetical protein